MGIEKSKSFLSDEKVKFSIPPGFVSLTSFTLKREEDSVEASTSTPVGNGEAETSRTNSTPTIIDVSNIESVLRHRPWILYDQLVCSPKFSDPELEMPLRVCLPKGVIRGCSSCPNCLKVNSRWRPEESRPPTLEEAPVFYPTEEEFKDTLKYVASLRPKAEHFGICRIVPPPTTWQPPRIIRRKNVWETSIFKTLIQRVDDLKNMHFKRKLDSIHGNMAIKRRKASTRISNYESSDVGTTDGDEARYHDERFESESGPEFTLQAFKKYADDFKSQYFCENSKAMDSNISSGVCQEGWAPLVESVEGEYWRIIENPSEEIEVLCGINVDSREFGSGFPVHSNSSEMPKYSEYLQSGWNLNNIPKLPGSLLRFENSETSVTSVPRLFMGMCFSSLCWKVEEHQLYSLSYMHLGSPKVWYGIPARYFYKFEGVVKKHFPQYSKHPELLWTLITQLHPSSLTSEGIPVYRCVQRPGEFVLTFPGAYHSELDCGFNCSETVNFAPLDWLPYGKHSVELYQELGRKTSISNDKLLLGAAISTVRAEWERLVMRRKLADNMQWSNLCGKDRILTKVLKVRVKQEVTRRKYLCNSFKSLKMKDDFNLTTKRECWVCLYDLHFSAISCLCSPGKYTCLSHGKHFCSCASDARCLLYRYETKELNVLVEALEGELESIKEWGMEKLGLKMGSNESTVQLTKRSRKSASVETAPPSAVSEFEF